MSFSHDQTVNGLARRRASDGRAPERHAPSIFEILSGVGADIACKDALGIYLGVRYAVATVIPTIGMRAMPSNIRNREFFATTHA